jgi:hypothetical protein
MADEIKQKDFWEKLQIVVQPLGGLLTACAVAYVGMTGSQMLERRQSVDTNARLYSELMSRREEAESSLRKDMFVSIISTFLKPGATDLSAKILNLELLAYNFHDSLNLKPLFLDIQRQLRKSVDADRADYLLRINRVAREITAKQLFALEGHGKSFRRSVDLEELAAAGAAGIELDPETIKVDVELQQLTVRMKVTSAQGKDELPDSRASFTVGFYDFPVIDNTRLPSGVRCAVTLSNFSSVSADMTTVCFPGEFASLKDRPYYDEVIQKLREANQEDAARAQAGTL